MNNNTEQTLRLLSQTNEWIQEQFLETLFLDLCTPAICEVPEILKDFLAVIHTDAGYRMFSSLLEMDLGEYIDEKLREFTEDEDEDGDESDL